MSLYPEIAPYESGHLEVGDGNHIYWETCGNPHGKPAVVLHGGPGSGCTPGSRRLFDPDLYRVVLFDQRNCGRSTPHASAPNIDLSANTTWNLVADIELLRQHLGIDRWLVWGGSWGSVLALAYAVTHPDRVSEMVLVAVGTGRHKELDWLFRGGLSILFPEQWERLRSFVPSAEQGKEIVDAYSRMLHDPDPEVCRQAATEWCLWESATLDWPPKQGLGARFTEPTFALAFARLVTHYVRHNLWLEEQGLLPRAGRLADIPGVLVNGRFDFQSPIGNAWELSRAWKKAELVIVDDAGHSSGGRMTEELMGAIDRFART